jgi:hypothetical protein
MWFGRLILFALLVVDWASDPYQGTCPFSVVWASTEAYSVSSDYREDIRKELVAGAAPAPLPDLAAAPSAEGGPPRSPATARRHRHAAAFLYLYMTLLC